MKRDGKIQETTLRPKCHKEARNNPECRGIELLGDGCCSVGTPCPNYCTLHVPHWLNGAIPKSRARGRFICWGLGAEERLFPAGRADMSPRPGGSPCPFQLCRRRPGPGARSAPGQRDPRSLGSLPRPSLHSHRTSEEGKLGRKRKKEKKEAAVAEHRSPSGQRLGAMPDLGAVSAPLPPEAARGLRGSEQSSALRCYLAVTCG